MPLGNAIAWMTKNRKTVDKTGKAGALWCGGLLAGVGLRGANRWLVAAGAVVGLVGIVWILWEGGAP